VTRKTTAASARINGNINMCKVLVTAKIFGKLSEVKINYLQS
jgi:hypothetical protein